MNMMAGIGYVKTFRTLDPAQVRVPTSRPRCHASFAYLPNLFPQVASQTQVQDLFAQTIQRVCSEFQEGNRPHPIEDYLLVEGTPLAEYWNDILYGELSCDVVENGADKGKGTKWEKYHVEAFKRDLNRCRPTQAELRAFALDMSESGRVHFGHLRRRSQELVFLTHHKYVRMGREDKLKSMCLDVSQSVNFKTQSFSGLTCFTGACEPCLMQPFRRVLAIEAILMQGAAACDFPFIHEYSNTFIMNLAGNAFSGPCFVHWLRRGSNRLRLYCFLVFCGQGFHAR